MTQTFKLALGGQLLDQVLAAAAADEVVTSEAIRRILWSHFAAEERGPDPAPIRPQEGPRSAHRSSSLPIPLPSPRGRGVPEETKAKAKASVLVDLLSLESTGGAHEAPAYARPEGDEGPGGGPEAAAPGAGSGAAPGAAPTGPPPAVLWLPCRASRRGDPPEWGLSQTQVERWQAVFPGLDVLAEARKAEAWLQANPGRWKTVRGMPRFLLSWLERTNDGGRFGRREAPGAPGAPGGHHVRRGGAGGGPAGGPPTPPAPRGSLREAYGRDSFESWEAELRAGISDPAELAKCLRDLAKIRAGWEAAHAA